MEELVNGYLTLIIRDLNSNFECESDYIYTKESFDFNDFDYTIGEGCIGEFKACNECLNTFRGHKRQLRSLIAAMIIEKIIKILEEDNIDYYLLVKLRQMDLYHIPSKYFYNIRSLYDTITDYVRNRKRLLEDLDNTSP